MNNEYEVLEDCVRIKLNRVKGEPLYALIDKEDLEKVSSVEYAWCAKLSKTTKSHYARTYRVKGYVGKRKQYTTLFMHALIMGTVGQHIIHIDHINHDTLDNRKSNLRAITASENYMNRNGKNKNNTSGYRNVCWNKATGKWCVTLSINYKPIRIGEYKNIEDAARAAEEARAKYYGEHHGNQ